MKPTLVLAAILSLVTGCWDMSADSADQGEVMKIQFERSGGFAGMTMQVDIDPKTLSDAERDALMTHVSNAEFFALPSAITASSTTNADRYNYRITIESSEQTHTVECTDGSAPASLTPLLEWLNDSARKATRNPKAEP